MRLLILRSLSSKLEVIYRLDILLMSLGSRKAIAHLFFMLSAWTSKKASRVHEIVSKLATALISNIRSQHEDNLSSNESYKLITSKALGTMHAQHFFIAGSIYD